MTTYFIACICVVYNLIMVFMLYHIFKKQEERINFLINAVCGQFQMLHFLSKSEVCHLWKIRQEIYGWQCKWAAQEEYRAAQQAKTMIENIEQLINIHKTIVKDHENN